MCKFFGFVTLPSVDSTKYYIPVSERETWDYSAGRSPDSHAVIIERYPNLRLHERQVNKYEYFNGKLEVDLIQDDTEHIDDVRAWAEQFSKSAEFSALCLLAVQQNGRALAYVPEHLRTPKLCLAAVRQYSCALKYVPEHLREEVTRV